MSDQIIILSDIHIKDKDNVPAINKIISIKDIIAKEDCYVENLYIVCAGDIAASGKETEYGEFLAACELLLESITKSHPELNVRFICAPGNHDVNYNVNRKYCESLLTTDGIEHSLYDKFYAFFEERFKNYFAFQDKLCGTEKSDGCYWIQEYNATHGHTLKFNIFNTAIYSGYGKDKGYLTYPLQKVADNQCKKGNELAIGIMHHPLNWFNKEIEQGLSNEVLPNIDILITGHDHSASYSQRSNKDFQYLSIETDAFDEEEDSKVTGIMSLYIQWFDDDKVEALVYSYCWRDNKFCCESLRDKRLIKLREINQGYELNPEFSRDIKKLPNAILNTENAEIKAEDIYVYPNLERISQDYEANRTISSLELFQNDNNCNSIIVFGETKSGKTMLARRIFLDLFKKGKIPLLIDYDNDKYKKIGDCIASAYQSEYSEKLIDNHMSLPNEARAIIIDNYNPGFKNAKSKLDDLLNIRKSISTIVVIIDSDYFINCSRTGEIFEKVSNHFSIYKIIEFDRKCRHQLISKWVRLNNTSQALDRQSELYDILEKENAINELFGDSLVPRYPMYISMFLGAMSTASHKGNYSIGTYGSLYQLVILQEIAKLKSMDLQNLVNFLSELSHYIYIKNSNNLFTETDYDEFTELFNNKYDVKLRSHSILQELLDKKIIIHKNNPDDALAFCHEYFYYYFIALYLDSHAGSIDVSDEMKSICNNFYKKDQANIWLFLTHISNKQIVVDTLVEYAQSILHDMNEVRFDSDLNFVEKLRRKDYNFEFCDKGYDKMQEERYINEDKTEMIKRDMESRPLRELDADDPVVLIVQANKAIDALGQLLRNFVASLDAEQKQLLLRTTIQLTLRTISFVLSGIFLSAPDFIKDYVSKHPELTDEVSRDEAIKRFSTYLYFLLVFYSSSMMAKSARSVAHKLLIPSYDRLFRTFGDVNSYIIFNHLIRLYLKKNPFEFIPNDSLKELNKYIYCKETIRCMMFQFIYMFVDDTNAKQSLCEQYNIHYRGIVLKESKSKY